MTALFHVIHRTYAELLLEAFGEVGGVGEAHHVAYLADGIFIGLQQLGGTLQADNLDHLVGRDVGHHLDFCEQPATADTHLFGQEQNGKVSV